MKLLHILGSMDPRAGGTVEAVIRQSQAMLELGVEVEIASLDSPTWLDAELVDFPGSIHMLGFEKRSTYGYSKKFTPWLVKHVHNYDAVIIHGLWQYHSFAASRVCCKQSVPYFTFTHGMLDPWFNQTYPLKHFKKLLYWFWGENPGLKHAKAVLFTTEEERLLARKSFPRYNVNEQVVGLGTTSPDLNFQVELEKFRQSRYTWAERPFFLFMSRIQEKKGLDLLVEAYSELRSKSASIPDLVIAGPIQQASYAKQIKDRFPQIGIHWIGSLEGTTKWQALTAAEAMVLTSHQENFGIVVAEALAAGTPVLISNKINIWREVEQGGAGLVESDTIEGARKLLSDWLNKDAEARKSMKAATLPTFTKNFDIRNATRRLINCIQAYI